MDNKDIFYELKAKWKDETGGLSITIHKYRNENFQKIIELLNVLQLMINDLHVNGSEHLYWHLTKITGDNPIKQENIGRMSESRLDWLAWGYEKGIIKNEHKLRDMTREQAIELVTLAYPEVKDAKSRPSFGYGPGKDEFPGCVSSNFKMEQFDEVRFELRFNLDVTLMSWCKSDSPDMFYYRGNPAAKHMRIRNQFAIQTKLMEWGYKPE